MSRLHLLSLAGSSLLLLALLRVAPALAGDKFTQVPVVVNVLKGAAPCTDQQIQAAIDSANVILGQANVHLVIAQTPTRDVSDGGNNDGNVTAEEAEKLKESGQQELNRVVGNGKGYKLYIVRDLSDATGVGFTFHDVAVSMILHPPADENFGWVIAHEFAHACTIEGHRDANNVPWGEDNLMYEKFGKDGRKLTDAQRAEIKKRAGDRGETKEQTSSGSPPEKKTQEKGSGLDRRSGDGPEPPGMPRPSDLRRAELFSDSGSDSMRGDVQVDSLFDSGHTVLSQCVLYLDTDANPATGQPVAVDGRSLGAEFRVEISIYGSGNGSLQLYGYVFDVATGQSAALSDLELETEHANICSASGPDFIPAFDQINFGFPRSFLGSLVLPCPVGVRLTDGVASTIDESSLDLESYPPANPAVELSQYQVGPGYPVTVLGSGFTPNLDVSVSVDNGTVAIAHTDGLGNFQQPITAPARAGTHYWVDARQPNGGPGDFSILHVTATPGVPGVRPASLVAVATLLGLAGAMALGKRKASHAA